MAFVDSVGGEGGGGGGDAAAGTELQNLTPRNGDMEIGLGAAVVAMALNNGDLGHLSLEQHDQIGTVLAVLLDKKRIKLEPCDENTAIFSSKSCSKSYFSTASTLGKQQRSS